MGRRKKDRRRRIDTPHKRKISEIIWEFAGDFIRMSDTPEEKYSLLNAACSAWSIACNSPEFRKKNLDHYMREYRRFNPGADEEAVRLPVFCAMKRRVTGGEIAVSLRSAQIDARTVSLP